MVSHSQILVLHSKSWKGIPNHQETMWCYFFAPTNETSVDQAGWLASHQPNQGWSSSSPQTPSVYLFLFVTCGESTHHKTVANVHVRLLPQVCCICREALALLLWGSCRPEPHKSGSQTPPLLQPRASNPSLLSWVEIWLNIKQQLLKKSLWFTDRL